MQSLLFATGNNEKFAIARHLCAEAGITLEQFTDDTDEIQSEDPRIIIEDKANRKFELAGNRPIVVSDDTWEIPGLNGFPGAYMKSMDHWFGPQQFIDLMQHVSDRTIILHQYLAYKDSAVLKIFSQQITGQIVESPRGIYGKPAQKVIALDQDNGLTIAEVYDKDPVAAAQRFNTEQSAWYEFIQWYKEHMA